MALLLRYTTTIDDGTYADAPVVIGVFFAVMVAAALCFVAAAALKADGAEQSVQSLLIRDSISALAIFGIAPVSYTHLTLPTIYSV